jgi:phosphoserine phosphatase RsbU/P
MPPPYLKWNGPEGREVTYTLTADQVLIGRKSDADIVLPSPYVSRQHARLVKEGQGYLLVDLKSTHGTYVNGHRIEQRKLEIGDRIGLGQDRLELLYLAQPANTTRVEFPAEGDDFEKSFIQLASILPAESSDLEQISSILDFQYQWEKSFSSEKTFQQILQSALKISGAERGFVLLKNEEEFEYVVGMDGKGRKLQPGDFRTSRTVVHRVATGGEAVFMSEGLAGDLAHQESIVAMNLVAVACLPLRWISSQAETPEVLGILYLDSTKSMHVLTGLDQKILTKLALEASNVFEKLEIIKSFEQRKSLEQELALAQETQKTILPHSVPELQDFRVYAFNQPTRYIGGDLYDFLTLSGGEWAGVLADVSGKGISASLLGSLLQGALHMQFRSTSCLEDVVNEVNQFLVERTSSERFVTLFLFALNPKGEGRFINAGHNPPYLFCSRNPGTSLGRPHSWRLRFCVLRNLPSESESGRCFGGLFRWRYRCSGSKGRDVRTGTPARTDQKRGPVWGKGAGESDTRLYRGIYPWHGADRRYHFFARGAGSRGCPSRDEGIKRITSLE